jgi:MFS family permease
MHDDTELRRQLSARIEGRRKSIAAFLHAVRPRRNRLANISIASSAMAAAFVAGPAIGGPEFTQATQEGLSLSQPSVVWRVLCMAAMLVSLVSVISTNLNKSHDLATQVTTAEVCNAELEALLTSLQFGHLSIEDATELYHQYVVKVPFVDETSAVPPQRGRT